MAQANTFAKRFPGARYWPDRQWFLAIDLDNSAQRGDGLRPAPGTGLVVLRGGQLLGRHEEPDSWRRPRPTSAATPTRTTSGSTAPRHYTIHIPPDPPAKLFWSFTADDAHDPPPNRHPATTRRPPRPPTKT